MTLDQAALLQLVDQPCQGATVMPGVTDHIGCRFGNTVADLHQHNPLREGDIVTGERGLDLVECQGCHAAQQKPDTALAIIAFSPIIRHLFAA